MVSGVCLTLVVILAACVSLIPVERLPVDGVTILYSIITLLALGWMSDVWSNREKIKHRMVLMVFLGYAVWIAISDANWKFSDTFCRWESVALIAVTVMTALFSGGCKNEPQ